MQELKRQENYTGEILSLVRTAATKEELLKGLSAYHERDIAAALDSLEREDREVLYQALSDAELSEILPYTKDISVYTEELSLPRFSQIIGEMDVDDAMSVLEELPEPAREEIKSHLNRETKEDIRLVSAYDEDMIGSQMTTNFIQVSDRLSVKQATKSMIEQAKKNDNLNTIYVVDEQNRFAGAIDLKDLIIARENDRLSDIIATSYPYVYATEKTENCVDEIRDYEEDSIPVLNEKKQIVGVITATDIVDLVDDAVTDDYAKLAGLTEASDLSESVMQGMKKRLPWLVLLLLLGIVVSTVVGLFENVVSRLALIVCFQSLILDMAGNVGTQSLAVTIRVLMDENARIREKLSFLLKELRIGAGNGLLLGVLSFLFIGLYIHFFKGKELFYAFSVSGCVGIALLVAMIISSLVGVLTPMFFHRIKVDPAVASGPLITTVNDLVAVVTYYGLAYLMLIKIAGI